MEIRHLRYFVVLYQQSNFTKAAELLFLSQSALSQQIMQLENELGFPLFVRNTKKTAPTEAAHQLYKYAIDAIRYFDAFQDYAKQLVQKDDRTIKILFQNKLRVTKLVDFLNEFISSHPDITVEIRDCAISSSEDIAKKGLMTDWDAAFLRGTCCDVFLRSPLYHCEQIAEIPYYFIVDKDHPFASKKVIGQSDFHDIKILSGQRGGSVDKEIRALGIPEKNIVPLFTDDYDILASMIRGGQYGTIGIEPLAQYYGLAYVPLASNCYDSVYTIYPASKSNSQVVEQFKEFIMNRCEC